MVTHQLKPEGRALDRVSSPAKDRRSANCATQPTTAPPCRTLNARTANLYCVLWDPQPVKARECISDVVTGPQAVDKTNYCVECRLELADQVSRQGGQYINAVVQ